MSTCDKAKDPPENFKFLKPQKHIFVHFGRKFTYLKYQARIIFRLLQVFHGYFTLVCSISKWSFVFTDDDDDDNRKFERRKAKSMVKARSRCLPMNLGLEDAAKGILADRERIGSSLADVDPMNVDRSVGYCSQAWVF